MNRQDIYDITEKVEEQWAQCGKAKGVNEKEFIADVVVRCITLKLSEMAIQVEAMPFGDTAASFAAWIRYHHDTESCASDPKGLKVRS